MLGRPLLVAAVRALGLVRAQEAELVRAQVQVQVQAQVLAQAQEAELVRARVQAQVLAQAQAPVQVLVQVQALVQALVQVQDQGPVPGPVQAQVQAQVAAQGLDLVQAQAVVPAQEAALAQAAVLAAAQVTVSELALVLEALPTICRQTWVTVLGATALDQELVWVDLATRWQMAVILVRLILAQQQMALLSPFRRCLLLWQDLWLGYCNGIWNGWHRYCGFGSWIRDISSFSA